MNSGLGSTKLYSLGLEIDPHGTRIGGKMAAHPKALRERNRTIRGNCHSTSTARKADEEPLGVDFQWHIYQRGKDHGRAREQYSAIDFGHTVLLAPELCD